MMDAQAEQMPVAAQHDVVEVDAVLPADRHPAAVYLAGLSEGSRRTMKQALDTIAGIVTDGRLDAQTLDWSQLRYQHTQAIRAQLAERYAPATANKMLAALRGALKETWRLGQMDAENYHRAVDLPSVSGSSLPKGRCLTSGELYALFDACASDKTPAGARDSALLAVLFGGGLRRAEAVALDVDDYDPGTGALTIRGKGRKERIGYASNGSADALEAWLRVRGTEAGALFLPIRRGGHVAAATQRLTAQSVYDVLRRRAKQAGVATFSPHDLRRSFVSQLLDAGADISTVQHLAGHANVTTTARYDRRGEATKRKASELLHVPYVTQGDRAL